MIGHETRLRTQAEQGRIQRRAVPIDMLRITATTLGGAQVLYTVGERRMFALSRLVVCNVSGSAATLSLCVVPSGGSAAATNAAIYGYSVAANVSVDLTDWMGGLYDTGTTLEVFAGTTDVLNIHGAGEDIF